MTAAQTWYLYVVECADGTLYTGISTDVARRIKQHNAGRGARYTASRRPVTLQGYWRFADRRSAMQSEIAFKQQGHQRKRRAIEQHIPFQSGEWMGTNPE